ncbi:MAG: helix-turn-helix domain-containing protein [Chitinophagales bacterium]
MGRKYSIPVSLEMSELQLSTLQQISTRPTTTLKLAIRANILLLGYEGKPYSVISRELGVEVNTVKSWQSRWKEAQHMLNEQKNEADLKKLMYIFFKDLPRSGKPKKFTVSQEQQIVALACDTPRNHGIEMTDWTTEMLILTAQAKGIVKSISATQVRRILKNTAFTTA